MAIVPPDLLHIVSAIPPVTQPGTHSIEPRKIEQSSKTLCTHLWSQQRLALPCQQCVTIWPQAAGHTPRANNGLALVVKGNRGTTATGHWNTVGPQEDLHVAADARCGSGQGPQAEGDAINTMAFTDTDNLRFRQTWGRLSAWSHLKVTEASPHTG